MQGGTAPRSYFPEKSFYALTDALTIFSPYAPPIPGFCSSGCFLWHFFRRGLLFYFFFYRPSQRPFPRASFPAGARQPHPAIRRKILRWHTICKGMVLKSHCRQPLVPALTRAASGHHARLQPTRSAAMASSSRHARLQSTRSAVMASFTPRSPSARSALP